MGRSRRRDSRGFGRSPAQRPPTIVVDDLGHTLDGLNAWGCLDEWRDADLKQINCYGPGIFRGYLPTAWAGVILWYKRRGYYAYHTLYMIGVWVVRAEEDKIDVVLGKKEASFSLPIFNAEGYHHRIQSEFRTFYNDNGSPPAHENWLYTVRYDPARRLETRQALVAELAQWAKAYRQPLNG